MNVHPDPLDKVMVGDDDPIGPFDLEEICGAEASGNHCLRPPHPSSWHHVSACDDQVDYVWINAADLDLSDRALTEDGLCCLVCGCAWRLGEDGHYGDCPVGASSQHAAGGGS